MRKIGSIFLAISFLFVIYLQSANANPIPQTVWVNSKSSGTPCPSDDSDFENLTIYLHKESIKAVIEENGVEIQAEYIFKNFGMEDKEIEICLPFWNNPLEINLKANDLIISYQTSHIDYELLTKYQDSFWEYGIKNNYLDCIIFSLYIPSDDSVKVNVDYVTELSSQDLFGSDRVMYCFSYLVGSARSWNHSIDEAYFEFQIDNKIYDDEDNEKYWNITNSDENIVFDITYENWIPKYDLIGMTWEGESSDQTKNKGFFSEIWENNVSRFVFLILTSLILLIICLGVVLIIRLKRNRDGK